MGRAPAQLHRHLHQLGKEQGTAAAADFCAATPAWCSNWPKCANCWAPPHARAVRPHRRTGGPEQSWGSYTKPADYLDSFTAFVRQQLNQSAALSVVVNRPKDLTRAQLKEVRLLLDEAGYTEAKLKAAWRNQSNQDIAARHHGLHPPGRPGRGAGAV